MKEIIINPQYSLYYISSQDSVLVELHDFYNLSMYREYVSIEEFQDMQVNPSKYI